MKYIKSIRENFDSFRSILYDEYEDWYSDKKEEEFSTQEIRLIKSLVKSNSFNVDFTINQNDSMIIMVLYRISNDYGYSILINKYEDEWFYVSGVDVFKDKKNNSWENDAYTNTTDYLCDGIDSVIKCIRHEVGASFKLN